MSGPIDYARPGTAKVPGAGMTALHVACAVFLAATAVLALPDLHNNPHPPVLWVPWVLAGLASVVLLFAARPAASQPTVGRRRLPTVPLVLLLCGLVLGGLFIAGRLFGEDPHVRARIYYRCERNLREIGAAMTAYATANGAQFPDRIEALIESPAAGLPADQLVCPATGHTPAAGATPAAVAAAVATGNHLSYVYLGKGLTNPPPVNAVLAYEPLANHGHGMHVLFGSFQVKWVPARQARKLIAELEAGHNPPRAEKLR